MSTNAPVTPATTRRSRFPTEPKLWIEFVVALIVAFGAGFGAHVSILATAQLDVVAHESYILKKDLVGPNILKQGAIAELTNLIDNPAPSNDDGKTRPGYSKS